MLVERDEVAVARGAKTLPSAMATPGCRPPLPTLKPGSKVGVYFQSVAPVAASSAKSSPFGV